MVSIKNSPNARINECLTFLREKKILRIITFSQEVIFDMCFDEITIRFALSITNLIYRNAQSQ